MSNPVKHATSQESAPHISESAQLARAIALAAEAHLGQWEKDGTPYMLHPIRVMQRVATLEQKAVAILHDVVEDTTWTLEDLRREGFSDAILAGVDAVTRRTGETYEDFVARAAEHPLGFVVKLADLEDNLDFRRLPQIDAAAHARAEQYHKAWLYLKQRTPPER